MDKRSPVRARLPLARLPQAAVQIVCEGARATGGGGRKKSSPSAFLLVNTVASAAAIMSLSGCGIFGGDDARVDKSPTQTPTPPPVNPTNLADTTARDVDTYTKRINEALAAKNNAAASSPTIVTVTTAPAPQVTVTLMDVKTETYGRLSDSADAAVTPKNTGAATPPPRSTAMATLTPSLTPALTPMLTPALTPSLTPPPAALNAATQPSTPQPNQPMLVSPSTGAAAMGSISVAPPAAAVVAETPMAELMTQVKQRAQTNPRQLNYAMALLLLDAAENNKAPDPAIVNFLPPMDQKLLTELTASVQALGAAAPVQGASLSDRAAPLLSAAQGWQAQADLKLPRLVLASRVDSFGVFTAVEPKFVNGKRSTVIIYCEVANFASQKSAAPNDETVFLTHLTQQDTLITDDGLLVWRPNPEDIEDRSHNLRHDFYLVKKLTIPDTLPIGKYTLRMTVTDKLSNKMSMASLPIEITAK